MTCKCTLCKICAGKMFDAMAELGVIGERLEQKNARITELEAKNKRLKDEIRKALTHTVEMGGSFNQWHSEISAILRQVLQEGESHD